MNNDLSLRQALRSMFPDRGRQHKVYVVSGPPASGKTTYVQQHKKKGDLVFDLDYICAALGATSELYQDHRPYLDVALAIRDTVLKKVAVREGRWRDAYIITASKDMDEVRRIVTQVDGELVRIDTPKEKCIENARNDERRKNSLDAHLSIIEDYFNDP